MNRLALHLTAILAMFGVVLAGDVFAVAQENTLKWNPGPMLRKLLANPDVRFRDIIFAQRVSGRDHWYGNFGNYCDDSPYTHGFKFEDDVWWAYGEGASLCSLDLKTGQIKTLLNDERGGVRDPQVHYSGQKILFSYRKGGEHEYHLYEINVDGTGLTKLTDGRDDDFEPTYMPDGSIMFCSSRCHRYVPCWRTRVATLYRCEADGSGIRMISSNGEQENTPWMLPDGRVLYMRWEYVDRNQLAFHHLWTVNPDGTGVMVYYGNERPGGVIIDAKPIPGTRKVVASFSPGHGVAEHMGKIVEIDPSAGPDDSKSVRVISSGKTLYRDPYPISSELFLVCDRAGIHLMNSRGNLETIYKNSANSKMESHEPRPLVPREREVVIPSRIDLSATTGHLMLKDVYTGRNMAGVERGEIKKLLVLEQLPKPVNCSGGQEPLSIGGTFLLERILGTVPVEPDGSVLMELPAMRSLILVALDKNDCSVKKMQSFVTLQPGEITSCAGCHERRTMAPYPTSGLSALTGVARKVEPITDVPEVFDFPRDIQPILDRHCVKCHNAEKRAGGVELIGDHTPLYSVSYWTLHKKGLFMDGRNAYGNRPPRTVGSGASPILKKIDGSHNDVKLSSFEQKMIRLWIDSGATYPGTYAALGCGMYPVQFPVEVVERRCGKCHSEAPPKTADARKGKYFRFGAGPSQVLSTNIHDITFIRRMAYYKMGEAGPHQSLCNLTRPDKSLFVRAPLAKEAGGLGLCRKVVFRDKADPDYNALVEVIAEASRQLEEVKRFDMAGFIPAKHYIREMKRFSILPPDLNPEVKVDVYTTDRAYWMSFYPQP